MNAPHPRIGTKRQALFNKREFTRQLQEAASPIASFKQCIKDARAHLDERFREGEKVDVLISGCQCHPFHP